MASSKTAAKLRTVGSIRKKVDAQLDSIVAPKANCAKASAVALYCHNLLSLERVSAFFARNPTWRSA